MFLKFTVAKRFSLTYGLSYETSNVTLTQWLVVGDGAPGPGATVPLLPPAPGVTTGPGAQPRTKTGQLSQVWFK